MDGLQREQFLPFINIIKKNSIQKELLLDDDYRTPEENKFMRVLTHLFGISDVNSAKARSRVLAKK